MMKGISKYILLFILVFTTSSLKAQNQVVIDSLQNEIKKYDARKLELGKAAFERSDSIKVDLLYQLAKQYYESNPEKVKQFAENVISLSNAINYRCGVSNGLTALGIYYDLTGDFYKSLDMHKQALQVSQELGDKKRIARSMNEIGAEYSKLGNYPECVEYNLNALKIQEEIKYLQGCVASYSTLGSMYHAMGDYKKSLEYYSKELAIIFKANNKTDLAGCYINMANDYNMMNADSTAMNYYFKGIEICKAENIKYFLANAYSSVSNLYIKKGENNEALKYLNKGLKIYSEMGHQDGVINTYINMSQVYYDQKKYGQGINCLNNVIESAKKIGALNQLSMIYMSYANNYSAMYDFKNAYKYQVLYKQISDSIFNTENSDKITQLQMQYDFDKKELQLKKEQETKNALHDSALKQEKMMRNASFTGSVLLLVIIGILIGRYRFKQKANKKIEVAYDNLKTTEQQLIHQEKLASLGALTAGIAHEIENPLNFVNNFSELSNELLEEFKVAKSESERKEIIDLLEQNLAKINEHGKRADSIVKNMLQHSRSGAGEKQLTDINQLCQEYLNLAYHGMRANIPEFNCEMIKQLDPNLPKINCVAQDISRVILNIINNAFDEIEDKSNGILNIATEKLKDKIAIKIRDNGRGIPDDMKEKIFEPFFTTKPAGQGTGLGLSLSHDIIKAHGGAIDVISKINEGTEFIITLPLV